MYRVLGLFFALIFVIGIGRAEAQGTAQAEALAKKLSNPISSLISAPYQFNYDQGYGSAGTGTRSVMNFQPVAPFSISDNWNIISRTIIPFIKQDNVVPGTSQSGVGDIVQSFFFSPKAPTKGGMIWGVGPALLLPTATDNLGADQFAAGITGVVLKQTGPWTLGALANHLWSVGDTANGTKISATFLQPFVSYTTPKALTFTASTESTYDWVNKTWSVPLNFAVAKLVKIGGRPISIGGGVRYWVDSPSGGADKWGARLIVTFLFPK